MFVNEGNQIEEKTITPSFIERDGEKWEVLPQLERERYERKEDFPCFPVRKFQESKRGKTTVYHVSTVYRLAEWEKVMLRKGNEFASTVINRLDGDYRDYIQRGGTEK